MSEMLVFLNQARVAPVQGGNAVRRVAAYCRVSTLHEAQSDSYETQRDYYRRLIEADPTLALAGVYGDHGISGLNAQTRPGFQRMMRDCLNGGADMVMTKSISRFARNLADCVSCVRLLKEKGIPVLFEKEGISSMDGESEFLFNVLSALAQEEANSLSRSIRWSLERRNADGDPPRAARYGYRKERDKNGNGIWKICESEAKRVRLAFLMAEQGRDSKAIITALDEIEIGEGSGMRWTKARVRGMLKSEVYMGDILTNKSFKPDFLSKRVVKNAGQRAQYYIKEHHEAIISRETFARAGENIRKRQAGRSEE